MSTPKVSVCISVHNTAAYLRRCLDSVVNQTLENIEIVLVNNGSTDNSRDIMQEYKDKYANRNIIIVDQNDRGLAQGRQTGVNRATGDYLAFLDADDYVELNAYESMLNAAVNEHSDIVEVDTMHGDELYSDPYEGLHATSEILYDYFVKGTVRPMVWLRLYHRRLFTSPVFPNLYINNEDVFAFPCLLAKAESIFFLHQTLHFYTIDNEQSVMIRMRDPNNRVKDYNRRLKIINLIPFISEKFAEVGVEKNIMDVFNDYSALFLYVFINNRDSNFSFKKKTGDVVKELGYRNYGEMNSYVKKNIIANTPIKKILKRYGIRIAYFVNTLIKNK